jgi:hypothetical protein
MRSRIIAVYSVIVALTGLFAFLFVRGQLDAANRDPALISARAKGDAEAVAARLQVDAVASEHWLASHAHDAAVIDVLGRATPAARGDAARALCDKLFEEARGRRELGAQPAIVTFVDANGVTLGRNGTDGGRDENLGNVDPAFKDAVSKGLGGSDIFVKKDGNVLYLGSWSPVVDGQGKPAGALLLGVNLNDALARNDSGSKGIVVVDKAGAAIGSSAGASESTKAAVLTAAKSSVKETLDGGRATSVAGAGLGPLGSFGDGHSFVVAVVAPEVLLPAAASVPYGILGATVLGLVMVIAGGIFLGNHIARPIAELEEGLLAILNGQADKRFNMVHPELGGLAFRIDQLLNKLMGVEEDNTDEEGRVSVPSQRPPAASLVGETSGDGLATEPAEAYYARLFGEYIQAKQLLGEDTSAITDAMFRGRIEAMEAEQAKALGRPVRYRVQSNGKEVSLLAVPLA